jgi:hypothetical protein
MIDVYKQSILGQFEAALAMLKQCIQRCPDDLWESSIAQLTVRQVAYHTLFFVDLYLTIDEDAFPLRELHLVGGDEREPGYCAGLDKEATLAYLAICLEKVRTTLASESEETLRGPSGFSWCKFSRAELHPYNLRHVQHHAGQLSSHLRRLLADCRNRNELRWVSTGWL